MIADDEFFAIVKLVSGEQLMTILTAEDESYVEIKYPMVLRLHPAVVQGQATEHVTAAPWCQFSEDKYYRLHRSNVMFVKKLHEMIVPHYKRLVHEHEEDVLVRQDKHGNVHRDQLDWEGEEEPLTLEEINKRIDMLQAIADATVTHKEEDETENSVYVEGNDTLH